MTRRQRSDRFAESMLLGEQRALEVQRADVLRIEPQHARKRVARVAAPRQVDQRFAEGDERVEVVRVALQQLDEERQRVGRTAEPPTQRRQLERRLGVRRHGVERGDQLALRLAVAGPCD